MMIFDMDDMMIYIDTYAAKVWHGIYNSYDIDIDSTHYMVSWLISTVLCTLCLYRLSCLMSEHNM